MDKSMQKLVIVGCLLLLAVVSFLLIGDWATDAARHGDTIASLDEKTDTVLKLSGAAALASAAVSAIPGDTATPIAEELADFTTYFLLVLCVLYSEKYLVTILGAAAFKVLIPCALAVFGVSLYWKRQGLKQLAFKLAAIGLALFIVIPLSLRISDMVYRVYDTTIRETLTEAEGLDEEASSYDWTDLGDGPIWNIAGHAARDFKDKAVVALNRFVESLAVMIVTACIIPLLVLLFFLWLIRQLTGVDLAAKLHLRPREKWEEKEAAQE